MRDAAAGSGAQRIDPRGADSRSQFNADNLFVRYRFGDNFPGAPASAPTPPAPGDPATTTSRKFGFLPR